MGLLTRISNWISKAEGQYRPGPYYLPVTAGWLSDEVGQYRNWWQLGYDVAKPGTSAIVEACISSYAQTIAMCPGDHWRATPDGGRERIITTALARLLRKPNDYQSISDFLLNLTWSLLGNGNAYALCLRNDRNEIAEMHLMASHMSHPRVAYDGSIFYQLAGNEIIDNRLGGERLIVPSRDVLHVRLKTPRHPLIGETPLMAAAPQMALGNVALQNQIWFHTNKSMPSFVLSTDKILTPPQVADLRTAWDAQSKALAVGGTPILTGGLKPTSLTINPIDAQLAELLKLSDQAVANVYRVPLQILGLGGTAYNSTELLMKLWINGGLGFALNHIEEAIGNLYGLKGQPDEYVEFDTAALLRSSESEYVATRVSAIRGGLETINEARAKVQLPRVDGGDDIRVQQQDVPLDWWENQLKLQAQQQQDNTPPPQQDAPKEDAPVDNERELQHVERARRAFRAASARHS